MHRGVAHARFDRRGRRAVTWQEVADGVIRLKGTGYEIRRDEHGVWRAYRNGVPIGLAKGHKPEFVQVLVWWHSQDLQVQGRRP
jgi:hypothetical protein